MGNAALSFRWLTIKTLCCDFAQIIAPTPIGNGGGAVALWSAGDREKMQNAERVFYLDWL